MYNFPYPYGTGSAAGYTGFPYMMNPLQFSAPNLLNEIPNLLTTDKNALTPKSILEPPEAKKLFVKGFPEDMSNDMVEKLLKEFGPLTSFKRTKGAAFGHAEFENLESVVKCLRLLHGRRMNGKEIIIKSHEKGEILIKNWRDQKEQEWQLKKAELQNLLAQNSSSKDKTKEEYKIYQRYDCFDKYMERDDDKIKKKLDKVLDDLEYSVTKHKIDRQREEERKEHPRERERESRKKQYKKELDRKYEEKLKEWSRKEQDRERERQREKEREQEREKNFDRNLEKELNYDSDEERRRIGKQRMQERKKFRMREQEEDEIERKREILKTIKPPEPTMPLEPQNQEELAPEEIIIEDAEDENSNKQEAQDHQAQGDNKGQGDQQPKQQQPLQLKEDEKEELKKIYMSIPTEKNKLFAVPIDWALFAKSNLLERKVRPFLIQKSIEYLGEEEKIFVDAIVKRLINQETPQNIITKVISKVLVDDAEEFVIKMWKFIVFELKKLNAGLLI